jgi:hypothetical protein
MLWILGINLGCAGYIAIDGYKRGGVMFWAWSIISLGVGLLALPPYWALRPLAEGEKRIGGALHQILKGYQTLWAIGAAVVWGIAMSQDTYLGMKLFVTAMVMAVWGVPALVLEGLADATKRDLHERGGRSRQFQEEAETEEEEGLLEEKKWP